MLTPPDPAGISRNRTGPYLIRVPILGFVKPHQLRKWFHTKVKSESAWIGILRDEPFA